MVSKNNRGYAMVIVLVVITVLFLLSASLSVLISGEISLSSSNFKRINAKYNAETGIEEAISLIYNGTVDYEDPDNTWDYIIDSDRYNESWSQGSYEYSIYEPDFDNGTIENNDEHNYMVISEGIFNDDKSKTITAFISPPDYGDDKAIVAGQNFIKSSGFSIDPEDYIENIGSDNITDIYQFTIDNFYDHLIDGDDTTNPEYYDKIYKVGNLSSQDTDELDGFGFKNIVTNSYIWDSNKDITFTSIEDYEGYVVYSDNNFTINMAGNKALTSDTIIDAGHNKSLPTVVIVDGDLDFSKVYQIEDMIFVVKGDITFNDPPTSTSIINSFLYAGGEIKLQKDNDGGIGHDFAFKGQMISKINITMNTKDGSTGAYYDDKNLIYNPLEKIGGYYIYYNPPQIVKWIE